MSFRNPLRQQPPELTPGERADALLRAVVSDEEWKGDFIEITKPDGVRYQIRFTGMVENIRRIEGVWATTYCGGPYIWNDYLDTTSARPSRVPRVDNSLWQRAIDERDGRQPNPLPIGDFYLGQYLGLKYDERNFLAKAFAGARLRVHEAF